MRERHPVGVLDTSTYIDIGTLDPDMLPRSPRLTAITLAELHHGVHAASDEHARSARLEKLNSALEEFTPLPFERDAAARYGSLAGLVLATGRNPRPRRLDLMIGAIASIRQLPLYTRNPDDFRGTEPLLTVVAV